MVRAYTPASLLYPIKVKKLLRKEGETIDKNQALFVYEFNATVQEWDTLKREYVDVERPQYSNFECEYEGTIELLNVLEGQELTRRSMVAEIEEPCKHEVQFGGLCANCGKDMNEVQSYNDSTIMASRATINTVHGRTELLVSAEAATKADEEAKRRLLDSRRLILVVDLDQTVIHASVDPTIGKWQNDPSNPNYDAVKDVRKFRLPDDHNDTEYFIKVRPGVASLLETMSHLYEMHIYTMATRAYAEQIAKIIDPTGKYFGDRILSRDESGSMHAKNLQRLFPVDTKMVVIIDDRADVWRHISNLVKVKVYEFFVGIGDINGSFLPPRPEDEAKKGTKMERTPSNKGSDSSSSDSASNDGASTAPTTPETNGGSSAVAQMVSMAGDQDVASIKTKEQEQEQTLAEQLEDQPLLQKQKVLDKLQEEEEANAYPAVEAAKELLAEGQEKNDSTSKDTPPKHKYRHNLLQDDDTELTNVDKHLRTIHEQYFEEYDRGTTGSKGSRVAELRPGHTKKVSVDELDSIPDVAVVMDRLKSKALSGIHIVYSGVIPLGTDHELHPTAILAKGFGITMSKNVTKKTTHVIGKADRRTAKVRQAVKRGIPVVTEDWLLACFSLWAKADEDPYRIHSEAPTNGAPGLPDSFEKQDYMLSSSDEEAAQTEDETDAAATSNGTNGLKVDTDVTDVETDNEDWEKYKPTTTPDEDTSPTETKEDWKALDEEFRDVFGDSDFDDASDTESIRSDALTDSEDLKAPPGQRKRKSGDATDDEIDGSRLQKRKKQAVSRTTSLTNMAAATSTPAADEDQDPGGGEDGDDDDGDLEAMLAAEMSKDTDDEEEEAAEENGGGTGALA